MNFEDLQSEWQSHDHRGRLNLDPELLLNEVRRNQRNLESALFRRDFLEVSIAFVLTIIFSTSAFKGREWSFYLIAAGCLGVGVFFIVDRWIQRRQRPANNDTLESCVRSSMHQVNHQIWLLRNILWWYISPLGVGMAAVFLSIMWKERNASWQLHLVFVLAATICVAVCWWAYSVNQRCVEKEFEPRRRELEALLKSLTAVPNEDGENLEA